MEDKVNAIMIMEILGKPAEHIKKVLSELIENLGKENNVTLISKKIEKPKEIPNQKGIFTTFAEVEIETDLQKLMLVIFAYMPSHLEIIKPEELRMKNSDLNLFLNELAKKLHQYDEIAKTLLIERQILARQIKEGELKIEKPEETKNAGKRKKRKNK